MTKSDMQIRDDVEAELDWDPSFDSRRIGVAVKDGVVTLSGHVDSYSAVSAAQTAAQSVLGVKAVANEITVNLPTDAKRTDAEIADSILSAFRLNVSIPASELKPSVRDGWVTLEGNVDWWYQKNAAEMAVRYLRGVRGLSNNIKVKAKTTVSAPDIKKKIQSAFQRHAHQDAEKIRITVADSTVTLEGDVPTWHERDVAEAAVWGAPGVSKVDDRLVIRP